MHVTHKMCVNQLFMLLVRLPASSRLLVVKFGGSQKVVSGILAVGAVGTP